jgi:hypothetical protein
MTAYSIEVNRPIANTNALMFANSFFRLTSAVASSSPSFNSPETRANMSAIKLWCAQPDRGAPETNVTTIELDTVVACMPILYVGAHNTVITGCNIDWK